MARSTFFQVASLAGLLSACVLAPIACAAGNNTPASSDGTGGGGQGGGPASVSSASASSSSGTMGPCVTAADCAATGDTCNSGTCINGVCGKTPTNELGACDDGKQCTENDACKEGVCTGTPKFCPGSDSCHVGSCDITSDTCVEIPGNDGAPCVDDNACTSGTSCSNGVCAGGTQVDCSFLDGVCSQGYCDEQIGCKVMPKNDGTPCNDNLFCTTDDVCNGGQCAGVPKLCADPNDPCKTGSCNEANDTCIIIPGNDGAACDDSNACTTGSTCSAGQCVGGAPANQGGACDDKNACTTVDTCNGNGMCIGSSAITQCIAGDGCCPANCTQANDPDCVPACCGDDQNPNPPSNNCFQGAAWIAWQYVPTCGFNVTRIELHTNAGSVALLADNGGKPGATLFQGVLGPPDPQGWLGADVSPPIAVTGGTVYWIAEAVGTCSIASSGTTPPYYGGQSLNGPWDGPYMGHNWTSHVKGECP